METSNMTDYLPQTRCTPEMKARLEAIAANSVARNISDHIRFAVERYIEQRERSVIAQPMEVAA